jgi:pimeloyl-ACP methyl ester carboxylesterase
MITAARLLLLAVLSLGGWFAIRPWMPQPSERFYLLVPLVALAAWLFFARPTWKQFLARSRAGLGFLGGILLFAICYAVLFVGPASILFARTWLQIAIMTYFVLALAIVAIAAYRGFKASGRAIATRLPRHPAFQVVAGQLVPAVVFFLAVLPYLLAVTYVHRFKIPNLQTPTELTGRPAEAIQFFTSDHVGIRGWFIPAKTRSDRTVVICHGIGANCTQFLGLLDVADGLDANALIFDFRGHGDSDGHSVAMGYFEKHDVIAAVRYLREQRPKESRQIVGLAVSMGASALILGAAELEQPFDAVLLDSAFASAVDLTDSVLSFIPAPVRPVLTSIGIPLASLHADCSLPEVLPEAAMARLRAPVLLTHFQNDPLIPVSHASRLFANAAEPKRLLIAPYDGHGGAMFALGPAYAAAVQRLLTER